MARAKKTPIEDMNVEEREQHELSLIANHATLSDKISWNRKYDNLQKIIDQIRPVEDNIVELHASLIPLYDEIAELRQIMIDECIHPLEMLIQTDTYIECKFCDRRFAIK